MKQFKNMKNEFMKNKAKTSYRKTSKDFYQKKKIRTDYN